MTREEAEHICRLNMDSKAHDKILMHCIDEQYNMLEKIREEIEKQEKWLWQAGIEPYNVDIAFDAIKSVVEESEEK